MNNKLTYTVFTLTMLLTVLSLRHGYAQGNIIITGTDTVFFDLQPDEEEYAILEEFYNAVNGKKWKNNTNWLKGKTSADMAGWYGVVVRNGDVAEIHLEQNNLTGKVPKSLYKLERLISVSLEGNLLEVETPPSAARLASAPEGADRMTINAAGLTESTVAIPVVAGKNLPVWGLAVQGNHVQEVDWRKTPAAVRELVNSGPSNHGSSGVAIDDCGRLAFYVLHSGSDVRNQLHIYKTDGTRLTNTIQGDPKQALNSANSNIELQVVRVPGKADEWFIIYSLFQTPCISRHPASSYCHAKVVYARVKYNEAEGLTILPGQREVGLSNKTFTQGKAVSRTVDGDPTRHYLYLAERTASGTAVNFIRIHRYIIDAVGINFGTQSTALIPAKYWYATIAGSSVELSPDEKKLAITNRNVGTYIKEDIIIFDLDKFSSAIDAFSIISVPELVVSGTNKTIKQLSTESQYACFRFLKNKLAQIEFSPSGRYLYVTHGGYPEGTGGMSYNTYLLQIDLQSGSGKGDYSVRMRIQTGMSISGCQGYYGTAYQDNAISQIQSAYDGKLYFTKRNSSLLFVIPNPDDPMPHSLLPKGVDLSTPASPNITMHNSAPVVFMPENIDGHDYLKANTGANNFTITPETVGKGESITLTITTPFNSAQLAWGDGTIESLNWAAPSVSVTHAYDNKGEYTITLTSITGECAAVSSKTVSVISCSETKDLAIEARQYWCATKFSVRKIDDCYATYRWNFGDGTTALSRAPMHVYNAPGTYQVSVTITYNCQACQGEITLTKEVSVSDNPPVFEEKEFQIASDQRINIISSAATTFSDTWPLDHNEPALEDLNSFVNGSHGVWRGDGAFIYNTTRKASTPVTIDVDGTYTLDYFNWMNADLEAIPKWVKTNTMTRYSAYGFELENKDVLDIYSAALYDYAGQLQTAHGVNMRNEEMAFTGFENFENKPTGNFIFSNEAIPAYTQHKVNIAHAYIAVIDTKLSDLEGADKADIILRKNPGSSFFFWNRLRFLPNVKILCRNPHPDNPEWSVLLFETAPYEGFWTGHIRIRNKVVPVVQGTMDNTIAHTGKTSMRIDAEKTFEQKLLRLEAGKAYHLNAWVRINKTDLPTPKLSDKLGIDVILKNKHGAVVATTFMLPEGKIIEGWQQVKGSFTCPEDGLVLFLKFKPGSTGVAWYDDIRLHPENGNMKSYVYDITDYRLKAILDEENFASLFFYDKEGNLYLTKKETEEGIKTITENISYQVERGN